MKPHGVKPRLAIIFGDQLRPAYLADLGLDRARDRVLMMEVVEESRHVLSHPQRTALFLSAMRHFAADLAAAGWNVDYVKLDDPANTGSFAGEIARAIARLRPAEVCFVRPGEWRVLRIAENACDTAGIPRRMVEDDHFLASVADFADWARGRKQLTMEYFYREMRRKLNVLMDGDKPVGGQWNFDKDNRQAFKRAPSPPKVPSHPPDDITREVIATVKAMLPDLYGSLDGFNWPVTRRAALADLRAFIKDRLPKFGDHQDAMWTEQRTLWHAVISPAMNLKLLDPREVVAAAVEAYDAGAVPLNAAEGFIRQVIGWREFIRGVYWTQGEDYAERNALDARGKLPEFYWNADTDMACMRDALSSVVGMAYAHHISRLMVTGNFAMIAGIHPRAVSDWYLGMYADGVDWVTLPNTLGMAMHADKGVVGTKPYAASGNYINRMSNYCDRCRYNVKQRTGDDACPFNVFYWDFMLRHRERFRGNQRMTMMLKNVDNLKPEDRTQITITATSLRRRFGIESPASR